MKQKTTKVFSVLLCAVLLLSAMPFSAFALDRNPPFILDGNPVSTLAEAFEEAEDSGSVITQNGLFGDRQVINDSIEVNKNVTLFLGKEDHSSDVNRISYTGENAPLFTIADGGVLTVKYATLYGHENYVNTYGGLFRVDKGGTLILDGTSDEPVVIAGCELKAANAKGGAIYCEQGGKVIVNGATFADNKAACGADIYVEQKTDLTVADGVKVNASYGESVDINALSLALIGEIGLTFHTVVPDRYLQGSFVLTSRTGDTVTYKIDECGKDAEGRYLAKYNLSSIELSEPVTLTVCDEKGGEITAKTRSAEEYGKELLEDETVTEKEKDVVRALLNYGHFAQIECAGLNGWEYGMDYVKTEKYADLTAADSVFDDYNIGYSGFDPELPAIGVQLCFGYKTDINLYFPVDKEPSVTVNGEEAEVEPYEDSEYHYRVTIKEISALDLAQTFEIVINEKKTITLSAMSHCKSAVGQNDENTINAVKALYEFYQATVKYNKKPSSPGEDTSYSDMTWDSFPAKNTNDMPTVPAGDDPAPIVGTVQVNNKDGKCDHCGRILSAVNNDGSAVTGSVFAKDNFRITVAITVLAVVSVAALFIVKKKKSPASGADSKGEE